MFVSIIKAIAQKVVTDAVVKESKKTGEYAKRKKKTNSSKTLKKAKNKIRKLFK